LRQRSNGPPNRQCDSNDIPAAFDSRDRVPRPRAPKIPSPDINRTRRRSRHAVGTFCTRFRHDDAVSEMRTTVDVSFIRKMKQRRAQLVAHVLIADGSGRCAEEQVAGMPYASPYCP
jgi:hypothetical protein